MYTQDYAKLFSNVNKNCKMLSVIYKTAFTNYFFTVVKINLSYQEIINSNYSQNFLEWFLYSERKPTFTFIYFIMKTFIMKILLYFYYTFIMKTFILIEVRDYPRFVLKFSYFTFFFRRKLKTLLKTQH